MTAGASTTSSTKAAPQAAIAPAGGWGAGYHVPDKSGTVTAVGTSSVAIDGTNYTVTSSSDIDKNAEASLSSLVVADKVTFSTDPAATTPTIDKMHAGNESLDRPAGDGGDGPDGGPGAPVPGSSTGAGTSTAG